MVGYFEETLAKVVKDIELWGHAVTPWGGIANKLKEMGYVVVEYANGVCGTSYTIYKNPISINGYKFKFDGKTIFVHTEKASDKYKYRLVNRIIHAVGGSIYDYKLSEYLYNNIRWTKCYCNANGYTINGKLVKDLSIFRIY